MVWRKKTLKQANYKKSQVLLALILTLALLVLSVVAYKYVSNDKQTSIETTEIDATTNSPLNNNQDDTNDEKTFDALELQAVVKDWTEDINGTASVVITDSNGVVLVAENPDQVYFAASIYKIYVAYEGYRQIDSGEVSPDEMYLNGFTRAECLDKMIRESDSPCAEKLWAELGKQNLTNILVTYGITNTSMTAINTTAADAANMLARISRGEGLSESSRASLLESMKNQIFRDALNKGFSSSVTVYNKIGFNELVEYHDVAILELSSGEQIIVSVLTESVGSNNIAKLAEMLELVIEE